MTPQTGGRGHGGPSGSAVTANSYSLEMSKKRDRRKPRSNNAAPEVADSTVYGESAHALLSTLSKADFSVTDRGMSQMELTMEPGEAPPVLRAVMRAEAELLLSDADELAPHELDIRTSEQRQADALFAVVMAASKAGDC